MSLLAVLGGAGPSMRRQWGFSLAEALVGLVLLGIVSTALYRVLAGSQRQHRAHEQHVALTESARVALAILPVEFRELSAGDGDILAMDSTSITFNSMQGLYVQCDAPDTAARRVLLDAATVFGFRSIDAPDDSVLVFAEGDPATRLDDAWFSAGVAGSAAGFECPGARASIGLMLAGVTAARMAGTGAGAPVRTFRPAQVLVYQDAGREWWLGRRLFQPSSGSWSIVQPVLGPLSAGGLVLTYVDAQGAATDNANAVTGIGVRVVSRSSEPVYRTTGATYLMLGAATHVALRNNPRY